MLKKIDHIKIKVVLTTLVIIGILNIVFPQGHREQLDRSIPLLFNYILLILLGVFTLSQKIILTRTGKILIVFFGYIFLHVLFGFAQNYSISIISEFSKYVLWVLFYLFFLRIFLLSNEEIFTKQNYFKYFLIISLIIQTYSIIGERLITFSNETRVTGINSSYVLLSFLPLILISFKKINVTAILLFFGLVLLLATKRGSLLIFAVSGVVILYKFVFVKYSLSKAIITSIMLLTGVIFLSFQYGDLLLARLEDLGSTEDIGSGRGQMYSYLLNTWLNSDSFAVYIFGFGQDSVNYYTNILIGSPLEAHSGILSFTFEYGLVSIFLLFLIIWRMLKMKFDTPIDNTVRYLIVISLVLIELYSFGFFQIAGLNYAICLAYLDARSKKINILKSLV